MSVFYVDVAWARRDWATSTDPVIGWHYCAVEANSPNQATLIAAQLVAATTGMPTRTRLVKEIPNG